MNDSLASADVLPIAGPATEEMIIWAPNLKHPDGPRTYVEFIDKWNRGNLNRYAGSTVVTAVIDPLHRQEIFEYVSERYATDATERNRLLGSLGLSQPTDESIAS